MDRNQAGSLATRVLDHTRQDPGTGRRPAMVLSPGNRRGRFQFPAGHAPILLRPRHTERDHLSAPFSLCRSARSSA